ncbi:MAG: peptide-methionine (R)-S-oxide reductase MsrB [Chitinophagales bacterium]|nr:peptide-methionine (R)-S-oxide reductase MsrB [Chitinophagales bacterium]
MNDSSKTPQVVKSDEEWKAQLDPESYYVLRQAGTEMPHTGKYYNFFDGGKYYCKACGAYLFSSDQKFHSSCGWPSFYDVQKGAIKYIEDNSHGMRRIETRCANCDSHLGHVFDDGPLDKTGLRYCINSVSLTFKPEKQ